MTLLSRYRLWRDKRALASIRYSFSLLISPEFVNGMNDDDLVTILMRAEEISARKESRRMKTLSELAKMFETTWQFVADYGDQEYVMRQVQRFVDNMKEQSSSL